MSMPKITFLASCSAGGAERMTVLFAKILHNYGYQCSIVMIKWGKNSVLLPELIPPHIPSRLIDLSFLGKFANIRIALYMRMEHSDIIFCSQPGNTKRLLKLKHLGLIRQKIVFRDYLMPHNQISQPGDNGVDIFCKADAIIAQTEEMKQEMITYYHLQPSLITVINNPLDKELIQESIQEEFPFDHSYTNYVAINRVEPQKDMETLLQAFSIVIKERSKSRLYICGIEKQDYKKKLVAFANELQIQDRVFFEGPQANPFKYLYYADVFCLSSLYEGLPNGMLEAMYLGKPIVITRSIPFISQVIEEGKHGYTVEISNPEAFAEAMKKAAMLKITEKFVDICKSEDKIINLFNSISMNN
jgi:glycosyltransferase involved in cell wall biosynthesis